MEQDKKREEALVAPITSKDPEKKPDPPKNQKGNKKDDKPEELSEEDQRKKEELELLVTRSQDENSELQFTALTTLAKEIQTSTSSMTSVPKPLKFLRPHFATLKTFFSNMQGSTENKKLLADILSVLSMTMGEEGARESLTFKLKGNVREISNWGHEYVRHLAGEIGTEYSARQETATAENAAVVDDLMVLVDEIIPFDMKHNAEPDACDLLMEVERLPKLIDHVDEANFERVCLYLTNCAHYVPEPEDREALQVTLDIYKKMERKPEALRVAIRLNDLESVTSIYHTCDNRVVKSQLAFILARQNIFIEDAEDAELQAIINNSNLSDHFQTLARDLNVVEAKTPEDIYKEAGESRTAPATTAAAGTATVDSARANLANTFVNAFLNAGFCQDKLVSDPDTKWIYKNKEHGMMSAAASLGMILLWNVDGGLTEIDKYLYSREEYVKAGALLGLGIVNSGVRNECDPAAALLTEDTSNASPVIKLGAILGLGIAYAGSAKEDMLELLQGIFLDPSNSLEITGIAALSLGLIFVGTAHGALTETLLEWIMIKAAELGVPAAPAAGAEATATGQLKGSNNTFIRFVSLGLGLLYLQKQDTADVVLETLKTVTGELGKHAAITVETCAYAGTGNVLKIQRILSLCGEHNEDKENSHQGVAVLGLALIAMGEDLGREMLVRMFGHLLQYGETVARRAVPLALGLLYVGDPDVGVMDTLGKLTHDGDSEVAQCAVFALGLIGAGTNNARTGNLLRNLASYYAKEPNYLMIVRLAQGLLHLGKGTLSLSTHHSNGIMHRIGVAGLLTVLHALLDVKNTVLGRAHYLLFAISGAIFPRMLMTFDQDLKQLPVSVRVGHAVDVVGQAGRPKTITGFQTHTTPVPIGHGERAELATDEYLSVSSTLEGFVILVPNPNAKRPKGGLSLRTT